MSAIASTEVYGNIDCKWSIDCEFKENKDSDESELGFTLKLETVSVSHGFNSFIEVIIDELSSHSLIFLVIFRIFLQVHRNWGDTLQIEQHLLDIFEKPQLREHWKLCPHEGQKIGPVSSHTWLNTMKEASKGGTFHLLSLYIFIYYVYVYSYNVYIWYIYIYYIYI